MNLARVLVTICVVFLLCNSLRLFLGLQVELVSKELNHLAAILHVYAGGLNSMK